MRKTRKNVPAAGWHKLAPFGAERTRMYKKCGKKCFLGRKTPGNNRPPNFPICTKGTCKINPKGVYAAYVRAKEWGNKLTSYKGKGHPRLRQKSYHRIARTAKKILKKKYNYQVGQ